MVPVEVFGRQGALVELASILISYSLMLNFSRPTREKS